jgi:hypothetical protein
VATDESGCSSSSSSKVSDGNETLYPQIQYSSRLNCFFESTKRWKSLKREKLNLLNDCSDRFFFVYFHFNFFSCLKFQFIQTNIMKAIISYSLLTFRKKFEWNLAEHWKKIKWTRFIFSVYFWITICFSTCILIQMISPEHFLMSRQSLLNLFTARIRCFAD